MCGTNGVNGVKNGKVSRAVTAAVRIVPSRIKVAPSPANNGKPRMKNVQPRVGIRIILA